VEGAEWEHVSVSTASIKTKMSLYCEKFRCPNTCMGSVQKNKYICGLYFVQNTPRKLVKCKLGKVSCRRVSIIICPPNFGVKLDKHIIS